MLFFQGSRTFIHPNVKIFAQAGPIFIGENNLIEEQTTIINKLQDGADSKNQKVMIIGDNNVFEVGACRLFKVLFRIVYSLCVENVFFVV